MNNVSILGRLTRDPDLRYVQGGQNGQTAVARFTVAVDRGLSKEKRQEMESQNKPTADFISCVAWGKLAENLSRFSGKGLRVAVEGRLETGSYEKDGRTVYTTDVRASNVEFIDWKDQNPNQQGQAPVNYQNQGQQNYYNQGQMNGQGYPQQNQNNFNGGYQGQPQNQGFVPINDTDIPF